LGSPLSSSAACARVALFGEFTQPGLARRHDREFRHREETVGRNEQEDDVDLGDDDFHPISAGGDALGTPGSM
jgi:hypothetical protein